MKHQSSLIFIGLRKWTFYRKIIFCFNWTFLNILNTVIRLLIIVNKVLLHWWSKESFLEHIPMVIVRAIYLKVYYIIHCTALSQKKIKIPRLPRDSTTKSITHLYSLFQFYSLGIYQVCIWYIWRACTKLVYLQKQKNLS